VNADRTVLDMWFRETWFNRKRRTTPLAGDWGYAGQKVRVGRAMVFSEAGWFANTPSA
jgi:hypothetical protein